MQFYYQVFMHLFKKQFFSSFQCLGLQFLWMKDGVMSVMFGRLSTAWFLHMCVFLPHSKHTFPTANLYTDLVIQKTNWWISLLRFIRFDTLIHDSHISILRILIYTYIRHDMYIYIYTYIWSWTCCIWHSSPYVRFNNMIFNLRFGHDESTSSTL